MSFESLQLSSLIDELPFDLPLSSMFKSSIALCAVCSSQTTSTFRSFEQLCLYLLTVRDAAKMSRVKIKR